MGGVWTLPLGGAWRYWMNLGLTKFSAIFMLLRTIHTCFAEPASFCFVSLTEQPAHEKIGVVDAQWIVHQAVPSLGNQGKSDNGKAPWEGVRHHLLVHEFWAAQYKDWFLLFNLDVHHR